MAVRQSARDWRGAGMGHRSVIFQSAIKQRRCRADVPGGSPLLQIIKEFLGRPEGIQRVTDFAHPKSLHHPMLPARVILRALAQLRSYAASLRRPSIIVPTISAIAVSRLIVAGVTTRIFVSARQSAPSRTPSSDITG
jgi:hypothetical protein